MLPPEKPSLLRHPPKDMRFGDVQEAELASKDISLGSCLAFRTHSIMVIFTDTAPEHTGNIRQQNGIASFLDRSIRLMKCGNDKIS